MQTVNEWINTLLGNAKFLYRGSSLNLNSQNLVEVHRGIGDLTDLRYLLLSRNKLTHLPTSIALLQNLKTLVLRDNFLSEFPLVITYLVTLELLDVSTNNLKIIPAEIGQLINLKEFYAGKNYLRTLPIEFSKLQRLQHLGLSRNNLVCLPEECSTMQLMNVDVSDNKYLKQLPWTQVHSVIVQGTSVLYIDTCFDEPVDVPVDFLYHGKDCKLCVIQLYLCELQFYLDNNEIPL